MAKQELPVSARDPIRFTPASYFAEREAARARHETLRLEAEKEGKDAPPFEEPPEPVYLISVPTLASKARWERERTAAGAVPVPVERFRAHLRDAVNALLKGKAKKEALRDLDLIDELGESTDVPDEKQREERMAVVRRVADLGQWAAANWPPYAEVTAQADYAWTMSQVLAAKHFLCGWEHVGAKFETNGSGLISEAALEEIPRAHVFEIAMKALSLMRVDSERRKN